MPRLSSFSQSSFVGASITRITATNVALAAEPNEIESATQLVAYPLGDSEWNYLISSVSSGDLITLRASNSTIIEDAVITSTSDPLGFGPSGGVVRVNIVSGSGTPASTSIPAFTSFDELLIEKATPSYSSIALDAASYDEGDTVTVTVNTVNVIDGSTVDYTIASSGGTGDFSKTSGTITISSNTGSDTFTVNSDRVTEGEETLTVTLAATDSRSLKTDSLSDTATINDTSLTPTFSIASSASNVNEGDTITWTITTTNIEDGFEIPWNAVGLNSSDIDGGGASSDVVAVSSNQAVVSLTLANDRTTEGTETVTFTITPDVPGSPTYTNVVTVNDTSPDPTYTIVPAADNVDEGSSLSITVNTERVDDTTLYWTIESLQGDFGTTSGDFALTSNTGSFSVTPTADATTEGSESFIIAVRTDSIAGPIVAESDAITINDTSPDPSYDTFTLDAASYDEGATVTVSITSSRVPENTTVNYTITSDSATAGDFSKTSGTITVGADGTGSDTFTVSTDSIFDLNESFTVTLAATDSAGNSTGSLTDSATINDTSPTLSVYNPNAEGTAVDDYFGQSGVLLHGGYLIVSTTSEDNANGDSNTGAVYVFSSITGNLLYTLTNPSTTTPANDAFGGTLAANDDYLIVGSYSDDNDGLGRGRVYVYSLADGTPITTLTYPGSETGDFIQYGYGLACDGNTLIISTGDADAGGKIYIYNLGTSTYTGVVIDNPDPARGAIFSDGFAATGALDISGTTIIAGAQWQDNPTDREGIAYVFDTSGNLLQTINSPDPTQAGSFGRSAAIDGNLAVIGQLNASSTSLGGAAFVFDVTTGNSAYTLPNPNNTSNDFYSQSVDISGNYVAVGSSGDDTVTTTAGRAWLWDISGETPTSTAVISPQTVANADNRFGTKVALLGDKLLAVSEPWHEENADGTGSRRSGAVHVFSINNL